MARCCTRRSSSSSPTCTGTTPTSCVVDLPPGTGDISISLSQFLPRAEVYVVTTPQPAAQRVAQRAAFMAEKVNLEVKGVIENMSWFTGDDGTRYEIFGAGGGRGAGRPHRRAPARQGPARARRCARAPTPGTRSWPTSPESEAAAAFDEIARAVVEDLAPTRRHHPELKLL